MTVAAGLALIACAPAPVPTPNPGASIPPDFALDLEMLTNVNNKPQYGTLSYTRSLDRTETEVFVPVDPATAPEAAADAVTTAALILVPVSATAGSYHLTLVTRATNDTTRITTVFIPDRDLSASDLASDLSASLHSLGASAAVKGASASLAVDGRGRRVRHRPDPIP